VRFALFVILVGIVLRLPSLWIPVLNEDEALYATAAASMSAGDPPYRAGVESKPPGIFYLYEAGFALVGRYNLCGLHALTIVWVLFTAALVAAIARRAGPRGSAGWAALYYVVFVTVQDPKVLASQCELLYSLPLSLAAYLVVLGLRRRLAFAVGTSFGAGLCVAAATLIKPTAGAFLGAVLVALAALAILDRDLRRGLALAASLSLGFASGWLLVRACLPAEVWHDLVYWAFRWTVGTYIPTGHGQSFFWLRFAASFLPWVGLTAVMWVMGARALWPLRDTAMRAHEEARPRILLAWWAVAAIGVIGLGGRFFDHYFPQAIPPLAALAGVGTAELLVRRRPIARAWTVAGLAVPALLCLLGSTCFTATEDLLADHRVPHDEIARYVAAHSRSDERVFVWGYYPLVYVSADRLAASRFVGCHYLTGYAALGLGRVVPPEVEDRLAAPGGWEQLFADLDRHAPALFVDTAPADLHGWSRYPLTRYPALAAYVAQHFERDAVVDGAVIYRRKR
jgi:4-amino-4-deoxy-L-arabinose transferase-like glycosyltransferase